ncbi:hypothetical protein AMAG_08284 [Allomyces macrogynus ATCC 38327]|uniref:NAD-dependent epimerase/dehydratase domain-containing protein n=1 Tax=Allomyces macrogynus (strain ATCC 38327) TaxID=578462 RepID=A0A0L0SKN6_ALLM3|nr:hypothetical protein AMAG_08284 [Allomyces macrogynus ATCC 38327]|eukprot:KNE63121.1 hypothetical protein AMAG_08284 [Allomyces macrogynus ATCC 38327]
MTTATTPALKRMLVVGGTGLVGQHVCRAAILRGWHVTSVSRKGSPAWAVPGDWADTVEWISGDVTDPNLPLAQLVRMHDKPVDAVVHAVGILFQTPVLNEIVNAPSISASLCAVHRLVTGQARGDASLEFDALQCASAIRLADELGMAASEATITTNQPHVPAMIYVSAEVTRAMEYAVRREYLVTKRRAESHILAQAQRLRPVVLRPGLLESKFRPLTRPMAWASSIASAITGLVPPGLHVADLADAVVGAAEHSEVSGVLGPQELATLARREQAEAPVSRADV